MHSQSVLSSGDEILEGVPFAELVLLNVIFRFKSVLGVEGDTSCLGVECGDIEWGVTNVVVLGEEGRLVLGDEKIYGSEGEHECLARFEGGKSLS